MRRGHVWLIVAVLASAAMPAGALASMQGAPGDDETQQQEQRGHARDARVPPRTEEETPPVTMDRPGKDPGAQGKDPAVRGDDPGAASGETGASVKGERPRHETDAERRHREWVESIWNSP